VVLEAGSLHLSINTFTRRAAIMDTVMKIVNKPLFWLVFQAALLLIALQLGGKYGLHLGDDSADYLEVSSASSLAEAMSYGIRTLAYPIFLKCVRVLSPSFTALPVFQLALHVLVVFLFYWGLRHIGVSGWLAMAISSSLLYSDTIRTYGPFMLTDAPASSLAIATVGTLLIVIARPRNALAWFGLTLSLFLTYQTRPTYLFLLLLPPLGLLLLGLVSPRPEWIRQRKRVGVGLAAICTLPFLAFCTLRWSMVGHFGLVSFTGSNLVGIAGQFLTEDLVPSLPQELRPLADRVLEKQKRAAERLRLPPLPTDSDQLRRVAKWQTPTYGDCKRGWRIMQELHDQENIWTYMSWNLYYPTAVELYSPGTVELYEKYYQNRSIVIKTATLSTPAVIKNSRPVMIDSKLERISWAIIKARPSLYWIWVAKALMVAVILLIVNNSVLSALVFLLVLLLGIQHALYLGLCLRSGRVTLEGKLSLARDYFFELNVMLLIAVSFALGSILLVIPVGVPYERYIDAAGVFLPTVVVVALFALGEKIRALVGIPDPSGVTYDNERIAER
jgi:hypothetical protein